VKVRTKICPGCNRIDAVKRIDAFDVYACRRCLLWLEPPCAAAACDFCTLRPPASDIPKHWAHTNNTENPRTAVIKTHHDASCYDTRYVTACGPLPDSNDIDFSSTEFCSWIPNYARERPILPRIKRLSELGWRTVRGGETEFFPMTLVGESEPVRDTWSAKARYRNDVKGFFR